ncbi:sodium:calcium antiporter [Chelativorans alearense]|uniref:sodium:calcium antiporter n=1 Tax=Chelativorans alearense TaxID=2681495 RepID=UPI0013D524E5|nr:sodium:calcium antiporter [Chelativorans alearense]
MAAVETLPLPIIAAVFFGATVVIVLAGTRLAWVSDRLADRTGLGEIVAGALFVGASTSLPGAIASVTAAAQDHPSLAIGNALGGLTAQTTFLAVADLTYRQANLEHAAASVTGLVQGVLLVTLLTIPLIAASEPQVIIWGIHPASFLTLVVYAFGIRLLGRIRDEPMWRPVRTAQTREEISAVEEDREAETMASLWGRFAFHAVVTAVAGYAVAEAGIAIIARTGLSATVVGTVFTAIATSLPELVTAIAAVRIGAVSLAVGDVIGGNAFEVLFLSLSDVVYNGSIYAAFTPDDFTTALIAILMTGVIVLGLLRRERSGVAGIGFESAIVLILYASSVVLVTI